MARGPLGLRPGTARTPCRLRFSGLGLPEGLYARVEILLLVGVVVFGTGSSKGSFGGRGGPDAAGEALPPHVYCSSPVAEPLLNVGWCPVKRLRLVTEPKSADLGDMGTSYSWAEFSRVVR